MKAQRELCARPVAIAVIMLLASFPATISALPIQAESPIKQASSTAGTLKPAFKELRPTTEPSDSSGTLPIRTPRVIEKSPTFLLVVEKARERLKEEPGLGYEFDLADAESTGTLTNKWDLGRRESKYRKDSPVIFNCNKAGETILSFWVNWDSTLFIFPEKPLYYTAEELSKAIQAPEGGASTEESKQGSSSSQKSIEMDENLEIVKGYGMIPGTVKSWEFIIALWKKNNPFGKHLYVMEDHFPADPLKRYLNKVPDIEWESIDLAPVPQE